METKQKLIKITTKIYFIFFFILIIFSNYSLSINSIFNQKYDCADLNCFKINNGLINLKYLQHKMLIDTNTGKILECNKCSDCTNSGYSTCMQPLQFNKQKHQLIIIEGKCECSHSGPFIILNNGIIKNISNIEGKNENVQKCKVMDNGRTRLINEPKLGENEALFRLCYSSAFRRLPPLKANNDQITDQSIPTVLVTVEQFWVDKYWQELNPKDLHLYYVFPVTQKEYCEKGTTSIPNTDELVWINPGKYQTNMDPKMPQEIEFERNVFAGAERARFYYEVIVVRENQLKAGAGKPKFEHRETLIRSDILNFELHPEVYGSGMEDEITRKKEKGKHDPRLPIVRPILRSKGGKEKSLEKSRINSPKKEISFQAVTGENIEEIEATTLMPIPIPKNEFGKIENDQLKEKISTQQTSSTVQTQMSSTTNIFNLDSKLESEADSKTKEEIKEENKKVKVEKDEYWLIFRNVLIVFIVLLFIVVILGICWNRSLLFFSGRRKNRENNTNGQMNGNVKKRVQNGKEYKEACNNPVYT
ncbi:hypothetical protein Mgra_00005712 [Meloidogyne graminicola]|uniref:Uncharacterized protein n=1 Tax=Meloidogyne graminicola TaxID=189291 RepID=A0A8S9ZN13_9BILA|nr:hypothetical protein Mgra_00005712 [Meloidogyne graminicola]